MTVMKEAIKVLVDNYKFLGQSNQELEDYFKILLKKKMIDVDDYSNAMELIYGEE